MPERVATLLEREAGHVIGSLLVMLICALLWKAGVPKMEDGIVASLAWLGRSMGTALKER